MNKFRAIIKSAEHQNQNFLILAYQTGKNPRTKIKWNSRAERVLGKKCS